MISDKKQLIISQLFWNYREQIRLIKKLEIPFIMSFRTHLEELGVSGEDLLYAMEYEKQTLEYEKKTKIPEPW